MGGEQTEEEAWESRITKRQEGVSDLREKEFYANNQDFGSVLRHTKRPQTPNPFDRSLSKRDWERGIAGWRNDWRCIDGARQLTNMGFKEKEVKQALRQANGCVEL